MLTWIGSISLPSVDSLSPIGSIVGAVVSSAGVTGFTVNLKVSVASLPEPSVDFTVTSNSRGWPSPILAGVPEIVPFS